MKTRYSAFLVANNQPGQMAVCVNLSCSINQLTLQWGENQSRKIINQLKTKISRIPTTTSIEHEALNLRKVEIFFRNLI